MRNIVVYMLFLATCFYQRLDAKDSLYVFEQLHFKITSSTGLALQKSYPKYESDRVIYDYAEGKDSDDYYLAEIRITDYSQKLKNKSDADKSRFYHESLLNIYEHHYPPADTTQTFRGYPCIIGNGNYVSGFLHGTKKQKYIFLAFFHKDMLWEIIVSDTKKKVKSSYDDFVKRIELT